jgi:predicted dehydrogenase
VRQYTDFRELLDKEKLDGCIVATEVGNHAKVVIPVLESGIHCFSEKPMECTVEKVDAIVRAARKAKGIYQVGFQRRYAPAFMDGIKAIREGAIGDVTFMQGHWHWPWTVGGWVADVEMSGGEIVEQACHHMDVMNWVMAGETPLKCVAIAQMTGERWQHFRHDSEDQTAVTFIYPNGAIFSYTHLFYLAENFTSEKLVVHGRNGGSDLRTGMVYPRPGKGEPRRVAEEVPNWDYGTSQELEAFAEHIKNNEQPKSNAETGRISTLMSLMARKAMYNSGERVYEPMGVVHWNELGSRT